MGEFADYFLDQVFDAEEDRLEFLNGHMSIQEAYERGIVDELGYFMSANSGLSSKKMMVCKWCKKSGLHWEKQEKGWRLCDETGLHCCPEYKRKMK